MTHVNLIELRAELGKVLYAIHHTRQEWNDLLSILTAIYGV